MTRSLLLAGVAALALWDCGIAHAESALNAIGVHGVSRAFAHHAPPPGAKMLYDQTGSTWIDGYFSQALSSYPQYDDYLADDFTVPKGHTWKVTEVDADGFYWIENGPAASVNILFWKTGSDGEPDGTEPLVDCQNIAAGNLDTGAFEAKLPKNCAREASFAGGKNGTQYWVTVQANMKGTYTSGYWAWAADNTVHGSMAAGWWYGGAGPICDSGFQSFEECTGEAYDLAFGLAGRDLK